jgi:hypothetical protein
MENRISHFEINFLKEAITGDVLKVGREVVSENAFLHSITRDDGIEMVRTRMKWARV